MAEHDMAGSQHVWQPEIDERARRAEMARELGGQDRIDRQHASGRLTARERIELLCDAGSFREMGELTGTASYPEGGGAPTVTPANAIIGKAKVHSATVAVSADDFTVKGGSSEATISEKWQFIERWALEFKVPLIRLVDTAGGSVRILEKNGSTRIPGYPHWPSINLLATVPVVGLALGPCAGLGAVKVVSSHFSVMVAGTSQLFAGGPQVVAPGIGQDIDKEALGGARVHARGSGAVDNEARSEQDAVEQARTFLSYLPPNVFTLPPVRPSTDDPDRAEDWLASAIPRETRKPYRIRDIVEAVLDRDSTFEIGRYHGRSTVCMLGRLDGHPVGLLAEDPMHMGGTMTAEAADKTTRFVDLCDTFHLPVVHLVDQPGVYVGIKAEEKGTIRRAVRARMAIGQVQVPWTSVFLRRAFGVGGGMYGPLSPASVRLAWPSARWGSIPVEGGVEAAYRRELAAADDPEGLRRSLIEHYEQFESPFRAAERFVIEDVIDPRRTRPILCEWVREAYAVLPQQLGVIARTYRV